MTGWGSEQRGEVESDRSIDREVQPAQGNNDMDEAGRHCDRRWSAVEAYLDSEV